MTPRDQSRRADRLAAFLLAVLLMAALGAMALAFALLLHDENDPRSAAPAPHVVHGESSSEGQGR